MPCQAQSRNQRPLTSLRTPMAAIVVAVLCAVTAKAQESVIPSSSPQVGPVKVGAPVTPTKTFVDLRVLPRAAGGSFEKAREVEQKFGDGTVVLPPGAIEREMAKIPTRVQRKIVDLQGAQFGPEPALALPFTSPSLNFAGIGYQRVVPADPNGAPGLNNYIQMINDAFQIFDKAGNSLAGPTEINQLWASEPTSQCFLNNNGDPVVLYDAMADRWLISQFALSKDTECIAISETGNPVAGTWYLYDFLLPFSDDYPKLGVWPDGYYFSSQEGYYGDLIDVVVFDRANMLAGNPAGFQTFPVTGSPTAILLPGDLNGPLPPAGTPNPYARAMDGAIYGGSDRVEIWEFHVDWADPSSSTFTNTASLNTDAFSSALCSFPNLFDNCIPQPSVPAGTLTLEAEDTWSMFPLEYRNFGDHETLVFNHTVNATPGTFPNGQAGVDWFEIRRTSGTWSIYQESTFAPDSTDWIKRETWRSVTASPILHCFPVSAMLAGWPRTRSMR